MTEKVKRIWSWVFGILGFVMVLAFCLILHNCNTKYDAIISIFGSVASLAGILVAIGQIHSVKSRASKIKTELDAARTQMENLNIFADINKHSQFIDEIEEYIRSGKYEQALITYKGLKDRLNQLFGYIENREDLVVVYKQLQGLLDTAGNDVKTLHEITLRKRSFIVDDVQMTKNLEEIKTFLERTSGEIKSRSYEKRPN